MKTPRCSALLALLAAMLPYEPSFAQEIAPRSAATEMRIATSGVELYTRVLGEGVPAIVLHGGPDFDQSYLLPELDRFQSQFRLIYYDQRGRGKSAAGVRPEEVTLESEMSDLDAVRQRFGLEKVALLGHSWGTVLALEYALRHPDRVSHLILVNPAPVSTGDVQLLRKTYLARLGIQMDRQREIYGGPAYQAGDPDAVAARYRIHFAHALSRAADYETLMERMRTAFISQGAEGILKARAAEARIMHDTWEVPGYDLLPKLRRLQIPAVVIVGEDDFIPPEIAARIARALPKATLTKIPRCGHFAFLECSPEVRSALVDFLAAQSKALPN